MLWERGIRHVLDSASFVLISQLWCPRCNPLPSCPFLQVISWWTAFSETQFPLLSGIGITVCTWSLCGSPSPWVSSGERETMIRGEAERPELTGSALEWAGEGEGLETIIHYLLLQHTISNDHRLSIGDCDVRSPCAKVLRILYNCFLRIFLVFQLVISLCHIGSGWFISFASPHGWPTQSSLFTNSKRVIHGSQMIHRPWELTPVESTRPRMAGSTAHLCRFHDSPTRHVALQHPWRGQQRSKLHK